MSRKLFVVSMVIFLSACSPNSIEVNKGTAKAIVSEIVYAQDPRTQICYAVAGYNRIGEPQADISIAVVDCDKVKNLLIP
jgi:hypothetical protein